MPTATFSGLIDAPAAEVFAFIADAENNPRWHEHVRETHWIDEGPTRLGRRGRQFGHLFWRDWTFVAEVVEWEPPHRVTFQVIEGYRVRTAMTVEPAGPDRSRVTLDITTPRIPGPGVDALLSRVVQVTTRRRERGDFRRLRAALAAPLTGIDSDAG
jgi:uncharacterized membrane protein